MISYNPAAMESPAAALDGLRRLAVLPEWLQAALDGEQVRQALARHVPEFVAGTLRLNGCKIRRLLLKDEGGYWIGTYQLTVEGLPGEQRQQVAVRGTLAGPAASWPIGGVAAGEPQAFGSPGWLCDLPELRLRCELEQPETALAALETLMDPQAARAALEQHIRAGDPKYSELRLQACTPHILSYKPGSRCTLRYELVYPPELAGLGWPTTVIVKAYRNRKGERAYKGMQALWRTALVSGDVVAMAEPLAWIPDLRVLVQGPLPEQTSLEELLRATLRTGASAAELEHYLRKTAAGLAALHQCGAQAETVSTWEERFADVPELDARLAAAVPGLGSVAATLIERLYARAAAQPAGAVVPTHGTFSPEQVLIDAGKIGFIDFDDFCMAEPAMDVGRFCASITDSGMQVADEQALDPAQRQEMLARLDTLKQDFVSAYAALAPISRERVALWEARDYLRDALHGWVKAKPAGPQNALLMAERHLGGMGVLA
jgi:hypothetical protein